MHECTAPGFTLKGGMHGSISKASCRRVRSLGPGKKKEKKKNQNLPVAKGQTSTAILTIVKPAESIMFLETMRSIPERREYLSAASARFVRRDPRPWDPQGHLPGRVFPRLRAGIYSRLEPIPPVRDGFGHDKVPALYLNK